MLPEYLRPHEVAILILYKEHRNTNVIASILHYKSLRPVQKVLARHSAIVRSMMEDFVSHETLPSHMKILPVVLSF